MYRADFRQTLIELTAPNGEWKFTTGALLAIIGAGVWLYYFVAQSSKIETIINLKREINVDDLNFKVYNYPKPKSASHEHQARMLERMIAEGQGKITGVSAEWDYEKGDWKKNTKK